MWSSDGGIHEVPLPGVPGRLWLCGKHHVGPDVEAVRARTGIDTVVCLTERHEIEARYPDYVGWLERHLGTAAVWAPTHDLAALDLIATRRLLDDLLARLRRGERLLVHCGAGVGRAGTTAVGLLVLLGMPLADALDHVRAHRPMAGPEAGAQRDLVEALAAGNLPGPSGL